MDSLVRDIIIVNPHDRRTVTAERAHLHQGWTCFREEKFEEAAVNTLPLCYELSNSSSALADSLAQSHAQQPAKLSAFSVSCNG
jgi:dihydroorotase-like cyclic amidohydrolase